MKDHREIGQELELFMFNPLSPGCPIWLPKGNVIYSVLSDKIRHMNREFGFQEVRTPLIWKSELYKISGHWDHYKENMFLVGDELALKPMNCPGHMEVYKAKQKSYRELPYRLSDLGVLHRNEVSGAIGGLTRCRSFCQDDGHCFVKPEDIENEIWNMIVMVNLVYKALFKTHVQIVLGTRPEKFLGAVEQWDQAEAQLQKVLQQNSGYGEWHTKVEQGGGAFYGPKLDFLVKDSMDRQWQTATIQLDFQLPERFDLTYVNQEGQYVRPIVIHRAIYGSFERFIGILLEHYQGRLPFWLSPVQVLILTVSEKHETYARVVRDELNRKGLRVDLDLSNNTLQHKVLFAETQKVPHILVVGDKEQNAKCVSLRDGKHSDFLALSIYMEDAVKLNGFEFYYV